MPLYPGRPPSLPSTRAGFLPPPVSKALPSCRRRVFDTTQRGGREERPRFSPAIADISTNSTAGLSRWTLRVGVKRRARDRHPHPGTPSDLARRLTAAARVVVGELSPWRSVLRP